MHIFVMMIASEQSVSPSSSLFSSYIAVDCEKNFNFYEHFRRSFGMSAYGIRMFGIWAHSDWSHIKVNHSVYLNHRRSECVVINFQTHSSNLAQIGSLCERHPPTESVAKARHINCQLDAFELSDTRRRSCEPAAHCCFQFRCSWPSQSCLPIVRLFCAHSLNSIAWIYSCRIGHTGCAYLECLNKLA